MDTFSKYLDDEKFIDWIANPTPENEAYWEAYILNNPKERKTILVIKEYLTVLNTRSEKLSPEERQDILNNIYNGIDSKTYIKKRKPITLRLLKYAAIVVVLISSVIYIKTLSNQKNIKSSEVFEQVSIDSVKETRLILDDKNQVKIANRKSEIDYKDSEGPVINGKDTLDVSQNVGSEELVLNQLVVPYGKRSRLRLEDGTIVHLNSGSRFVFPRRFVGTQREVYLDGEAFFEVESDIDRPFRVKVFKDDNLSIEAVGTSFNVNSYSFHDEVFTVLTEGEVHLKDDSQNSFFGKEDKTVMQPGELAEWSVKNKIVSSKKKVDTELYTSWIKGVFSFKSEPLKNIVGKLEIYYNVEISFDNTIDQQFKITGKLDLNDNIEKTMENLVLTNSMIYEKIEGEKFLISK